MRTKRTPFAIMKMRSANCIKQAAVSAVYDVVDLFQCVLGTSLHPKIVNDEQGIAAELVDGFISPGKAVVQLVQDSGEVCHAHRHLLFHQSVRNAPGKETLLPVPTPPQRSSPRFSERMVCHCST